LVVIESYVTNIKLQVTGRPRPCCGLEIIVMAADDAIDVNSGFKEFMIAVDSYAATNLL